MADQEKDNILKESRQSNVIGETNPNSSSDYREEAACELAGPVSLKKSSTASDASVNREESSRELAVVPVSLKKDPMGSAANREETSRELAVAPVSIKKAPLASSANHEEIAEEIAESASAKNFKKDTFTNHEETAAEIAAPVSFEKFRAKNNDEAGANGQARAGTGVGILAIALSIISLFVMPILFGAAGIILGFIARARGAGTLGAWAIGIGVVSIIIGIFIIPFF